MVEGEIKLLCQLIEGTTGGISVASVPRIKHRRSDEMAAFSFKFAVEWN